jgi:hypothetical protein
MDYRVSYEHSLASAPDDYVAKVPSQVVEDVPANIPRALLPEYITGLILKRSARIGRIRHLRILSNAVPPSRRRGRQEQHGGIVRAARMDHCRTANSMSAHPRL